MTSWPFFRPTPKAASQLTPCFRFAILSISLFIGTCALVLLTPSSFAQSQMPAKSTNTIKITPVESDPVCSALNPEVCAHLHFLSALNTHTEAEFVFHAEPPQDQEIKDLKIDLWMDMGQGAGHASAPVELVPMGLNKYHVQNAWFVMPGHWIIRTSFKLSSVEHHINFAIDIKE